MIENVAIYANGKNNTWMYLMNELIDETLHAVLRHVLAHVVIDASPSENDLAVIAQHFRFIGQIIGIVFFSDSYDRVYG